MLVDTTNVESIIAFIITLIAALYAWYQNRQKTETINAFIPGTEESQTPTTISKLPDRTWKMSDSTKRWLTFDATPENKIAILNAVEEAENQKLTHYTIGYEGGYYEIEYGLLKGGSGNPHDISL